MSFWTNFEKICRARGTTPTTIVHRELGFSSSKVQLWKNGSLPKEEMLTQLASALNCNVADFFASDTPQVIEPADDDEKDILNLYRKLNRKHKHEFMAMVYEYERGIERGDSEVCK